MKRLLVFCALWLLLALAAGCTAATATPTLEPTSEPAAQATPQSPAEATAALANPASENCVAQGGTLRIEERGDLGQIGVCYFDDNRQCEEWAMLRGDCPVGGLKVTGYVTEAGRYCAITGGTYTANGAASADPEQGACAFPDGTQCDVWEYYNGTCSPGTAAPAGETPSAAGITPLSMELCDGQAQAMSHALNDLIPTVTEEPLSDLVSGASGVGCQATITGTGADFASPMAVVGTLGGMLQEQGWTEDQMFLADGPTGTATGFRKDGQLCLVAADWSPAESANCPADQPISTCAVTPEQQLYTVTLNCGQVAQQ